MRLVFVACLVVGCGHSSGGGGGGDGGGGGGGGHEGALAFAMPATVPGAMGKVVATGDVNQDGKPDLVVALNGPMANGGNALVGSGGGTFTVAAAFSTVGQATWLALGDFDGNGSLDLAATLGPGVQNGNIAVLPGHGDGTFAGASGVVGEQDPVAVVSGDFNKDGKLDAATANENGAPATGASVFLVGQTTHTNYTVGRVAQSIATADWNGDGAPDLAVGGGDSTGGNLTILLGHADGTFTAMAPMSLPREVLAIGAGDFDGDGKLDLVAGTGGGDLFIGRGAGDGTFVLGAPVHALDDIGAVDHLEVADFNGGGRLDVAALVTPGAGQAFITVLLGDGAGGLGTPVPFGGFDTGGVTHASMTSGDYDGDGKRDLAVAHGTVDLFLNRSM